MITPVDDLDHIMAVMETAFDPQFGEAWTRRQVEDALLLGNCFHGLVMHETVCAGFFLSRLAVDEEELLLLAVSPAARRQGHGAALLEQFMLDARSRGAVRVLLEMREGNPAELLYRKFGFGQIGFRPDYYRGKDGHRRNALTFAYEFERNAASNDPIE